MNPLEVKILLLKRGLTFAGMASKLVEKNRASQRSLEVMIADLLYGRRWYPSLAKQLATEFDLQVKRPTHLQPIREQIRNAA